MNGSKIAFRSASNRESAFSNHLSGLKTNGSTKFNGDREAVFPGIPTRV